MPSKRKFHKTTFTMVVLSEEAVPDHFSLEDLAREGDAGSYVIQWETDEAKEIDAPTAAKELSELGSESEHFELDEHGNDLD